MKNKHLVVLIIILSVIAIISSPKNSKTAFFNQESMSLSIINTPKIIEPEEKIIVRLKNPDNSITTIELEDYIVGVVAGEMPASFYEEALKAQAVAARSYALNKLKYTNNSYYLTTDTKNQVYITVDDMQKKWQEDYEIYYNKIKDAVISTKDLVMMYNGEIISAYYFAMSNGKTENSEYAFSENKDYLVSVDSTFEENLKGFLVTKTITIVSFLKSLGLDGTTINISDLKRTPSGRVSSIEINGKSFTGNMIRTKLGLRSTDFTINVTDKVVITTKGYGHGVGMSQYGANYLASIGKNYEEILKYYYQNVDIMKLGV